MTTPSKLYKYESWNSHSVANLKNSQIYFSDPMEFNDPFDNALDFNIAELSDDEFSKVHSHFHRQCPDKIAFEKKFGKVCNKEFRSHLTPIIKEKSKEATHLFLRNRGVSCFSETNNEILMWSHYSKSHTGFCLEFDTSFTPFSEAKEVQYKETFPELNSMDALVEQKKFNAEILLLTKYKSWKYEKEWRVFHQKKHVLYRYPPHALTSIYFGVKMPLAHCEIIAAFIHIQSPETVFYRADKSNSNFKLKFKKMHLKL